ncbi:hypothetical protein FACS189496_3920 [Bacilli bacterium]|nr:hypothetical protein FACS189496_3920 [Bacilli bacterium]
MKLKKLLQLTIPLSFCLCPPIIFIISSCGNQSIPKAPNEFYSGVNDYDNTFAKKMHPWKDA